MDGSFFEFVDNEDDYFNADSMAKDNLANDNYTNYSAPVEEVKDNISNIPIYQKASVLGAMVETETDDNTEITNDIKEFISLAEEKSGPIKYKRPIGVFEQFVQDVISGKKSIRD